MFGLRWVYLFVEGRGSRVPCRGSRVTFFFPKTFFFGKILATSLLKPEKTTGVLASHADFLRGSSRVTFLPTYHTLQSLYVCGSCLACQHFDLNSADWISDNLHVISSRYLRTMGKEFIFRFSRRSWGRNAWRTPKNVCVGGYGSLERPYHLSGVALSRKR